MDTFYSDIHNNSLLFLSLTQSRQAWTTALFRRYAPDVSQSSVDETSTANGDDIAPKDPELVGSCTVVIGPHMFPDTRFFRFPYRSAQRTVTKQADNVKGAKNDGDDIIMHETIESTHVSYQLAFEFRENPTDRWLLPEDAVIEALSMSAPYEVIATFRLPSLHGDVATKSTGQHITMHFSEVSEELWQAIRAASGDQEQAIQRLVKDIQVNLDDAFGPIRMPFEQPLTLTEILGKRVESDDRISLYGGLNGNGSINPAKINLAPKKRASDCTVSRLQLQNI
ncbi:hypothetical protein BDF19DRAFT_51506 [Syncephalis fuscata]|nr:hypothetical protein BDF19DRAFT_51506 [Syncephalis fuscata]